MAPKYYKRKYKSGARDKYSVEQQAGFFDVPASSQSWSVVVPDTSTQGMRKVKHLTVSLANQEGTTEHSGVSFWALVYVPQGTAPNTLTLSGTTGMYEPNQFVMNCGVCDFSAGPVRFTSPLSRNLNSGDRIVLIMSNQTTAVQRFWYTVRYAITLQ